jgi:IstB-like ATP binding protein
MEKLSPKSRSETNASPLPTTLRILFYHYFVFDFGLRRISAQNRAGKLCSFMEVVIIKEFSVDSGQQTFKDIDIYCNELAYVAMPEAAAELLFQVIAGRAERAAVIVTTNLPFSEWTSMSRVMGTSYDPTTHLNQQATTAPFVSREASAAERLRSSREIGEVK